MSVSLVRVNGASRSPVSPVTRRVRVRGWHLGFQILPQTWHVSRHASNSTTSSHNSLQSFLRHARRTSLSPSSTVYAGTLYEYQCLAALKRLGLRLSRVGGRDDKGIDLNGKWCLPQHSEPNTETPAKKWPSVGAQNPDQVDLGPVNSPLDVIVQCKALKVKAGPALVRELEGALARRTPQTVAVLCAQRPATKGVRDALRTSKRALVWVQVDAGDENKLTAASETGEVHHNAEADVDDEDAPEDWDFENGSQQVQTAVIRQMLWNEAAAKLGLRELDVTVKQTEDGDGDEAEIILIWRGKVWEQK